MTPRHRVSRAAIELLKRFEGLRARSAQLPDGRWTVGYGHTLSARSGLEVSEKDAEDLLLYDLMAVVDALNESIFAPLTQNQFDALCSFAFNVGLDSFRHSTVLRRLNEGLHLQAACEMEMWRQAEINGERIVVDALVRRRSAEKTLFLTPPNAAWLPAPSAILRPLVDPGAAYLAPDQAPAPVSAALEGDQLILVRGDAGDAVHAEDEDLLQPQAVAEPVQGRLDILHADAEEEAGPGRADPEPEVSAEPQVAGEWRPQADFAPPVGLVADAGLQQAEDLAAADIVVDEDADEADAAPQDATVEIPPVSPTGRPATTEGVAPRGAGQDDIYPFRQPIVATPPRRRAGLISLLLLAVIGLAFFAGGLFWGTNATATSLDSFITPRVVGALAGLAGLLMFSIAAFALLGRLGKAAEDDDDDER